MRIAYLTCVYPPYPGGIGIVAQGLAQEMVTRGHEVEVFISRGSLSRLKSDRSGLEISSTSDVIRYNPREHCMVPWLQFGNAAFLPQLVWRLKNFDIVHLLYPFFGVAELIPIIKKTSGAKIVVHHTMDAVDIGWRGKFFKWHTKYLMPRIFRAADRVLVLSEDYWHNSALEKLKLKNVDILPNGVDTNLFRPWAEQEITNSKSQIPNKSHLLTYSPTHLPTILFIGGLDRAHYFKGVYVLIEAARLLKERQVRCRIWIIGEGKMRKEYEVRARQIKLIRESYTNFRSEISVASVGVEFLGLVAHQNVSEYYRQAAVVVVPSTAPIECFSIVAAEAQACGVPVIVSDFPGVRVTVEDGKTGYVVQPGDPEDLANRIQELVENPARARKMGTAGRKRAVEMYSWKKIGDKLEAVYQSLKH